MMLYSHLAVAGKLEAYFLPRQYDEYYLGSIFPDIRYVLSLPRQHTHLSMKKLNSYYNPSSRDFIAGFQTHIAADNVSLTNYILSSFPKNIVKFILPSVALPVILEIYFLNKCHLHPTLSCSTNEVTKALDISDKQLEEFTGFVSSFLSDPSIENGIKLLGSLSTKRNEIIRRYIRWAKLVNKLPFVRKFLLNSVDENKLIEDIRTIIKYQQYTTEVI
jgi:hypothetical protein